MEDSKYRIRVGVSEEYPGQIYMCLDEWNPEKEKWRGYWDIHTCSGSYGYVKYTFIDRWIGVNFTDKIVKALEKFNRRCARLVYHKDIKPQKAIAFARNELLKLTERNVELSFPLFIDTEEE